MYRVYQTYHSILYTGTYYTVNVQGVSNISQHTIYWYRVYQTYHSILYTGTYYTVNVQGVAHISQHTIHWHILHREYTGCIKHITYYILVHITPWMYRVYQTYHSILYTGTYYTVNVQGVSHISQHTTHWYILHRESTGCIQHKVDSCFLTISPRSIALADMTSKWKRKSILI